VDPRANPYTPNAGARPPALVGRRHELDTFEVLLDRLRAGRSEQSMIITGLRGVGKTVLLSAFRDRAMEREWVVIEIEISKHDDDQFRAVLARELRKALFAIAPKAKWADRTRRAAQVLRSFTIGVDPDGRLTAGFGVEPAEGQADSGALDADLTDVLVAIGEAAHEHRTGVVLLLDEIQFLNRAQLEALIAGIHKTVQRALPMTLTAAGLPQLAELAGEAKSYAERLFKFTKIDKLSAADAKLALTGPAAAGHGATFSHAALALAIDFTEGYPYFLQEFGQAAWNVADGPQISDTDARDAQGMVEEKLDSGFFRVRHARTTELELAYLRAMAQLGPQPHLAGAVARLLGRTSQQCGPTRSLLIEKGLLYTPEHGYAAFTVPQFDRYLKRTIPNLVVPPIRERSRRPPRAGEN
jgi:hypothetical protein